MMLTYIGAALFFFFGATLLYWLQEKKQTDTEIYVAWIELYKTSVGTSTKKRLWRWPLYLLHCVLLGLLTLLLFDVGVAAPKTQIVILDRSLSMSSSSASKGMTRFDTAKKWLIDQIREHPLDEVEVYTFGGERKRTSFGSKIDAEKYLQSLESTYLGGNLGDVIEILNISEIESINPRHLLIATDTNLNKVHKKLLEEMLIPAKAYVVGGGRSNVFIEDFSIISGFLNHDPRDIQVSYNIKQSSPQASNVTVKLALINVQTGKEIASTVSPTASVGASGLSESMSLKELMHSLQEPSFELPAALKLTITADNKKNDSISEDNTAWVLLPDLAPIRIAVFDSTELYKTLAMAFKINHSLKENKSYINEEKDTAKSNYPNPLEKNDKEGRHLTNATSQIEGLSWIRKIEFINMTDSTNYNKPYDIAIYNRTPPRKGESLPDPATIYFLARPSRKHIKFPEYDFILDSADSFLNLTENTLLYGACDISSWRQDDPLMGYLNNFSITQIDVSLYPFQWAVQMATVLKESSFKPDWLQTVVSCQPSKGWGVGALFSAPVVMRGINKNRYAVVMNFDVNRTDLVVNKDIKILTLNTIRWLYDNTRLSASFRGGDRILIPGANMDFTKNNNEPSSENRNGKTTFRLKGAGINRLLDSPVIPPLEKSGIYYVENESDAGRNYFTVGTLKKTKEYYLTDVSSGTIMWDNLVKKSTSSSNYLSYRGERKKDFWNKLLIFLILFFVICEFVLYYYFYRLRNNARSGRS